MSTKSRKPRKFTTASESTATKLRSSNKYRRLTLVGLPLVIFIVVSVYLFWDLPNPTRLVTRPAPSSTQILDRHGKLLYEVFERERRSPIKIDTIPKYVWEASVASEDRDFFKHSGFSLKGIARAFVSTFFKRQLQGGSTITQQLVKNALLTQDRTLRRKIREFTLSVAVESLYKKDQILEFYLNQVSYGGTSYGIESAARTYFNKSTADLTLAQAALLAGLPQAPSYYSPFGSKPELAKDRQKYVLSRMLEDKYITQDQYHQALAEPLVYSPPPEIQAPHFSLWVKDLLLDKYGTEMVEQEGLVVTTTLDLDLQNFAQAAVASEVAKLQKEHVGNGAALILHPKTGEVLAMVGSKDYFDAASDGNVNVTLAHRQPGSAIKPVNYAIGIDRKLITPATLLADKATCFTQIGQPPYCPENYDNSFHGPTQVRFALGNSFNIPAVKALVLNGLNDFVASSSAFGLNFGDPKQYGPSITLGGGEVTMLDLASAYSVFANTGTRVDINPLLEVHTHSGKQLFSAPMHEATADQDKINAYDLINIESKKYLSDTRSNTRVISAGTAFLISHILYDNGARSATFGQSSYLNVKGHDEVSVKTGTTNDKRDNWTIGYNPDILVAVWVGNNDNTAMSQIASGVTGASPIWNKITTYALSDYKPHWPVQPAEIIGSLVCAASGRRVPENPDPSCSPRYEYFLNGTLPDYDTNTHRDINIYKPTQAPASPKQIIDEPDNVEMQNHAVIFDPLGSMLCLDCPGGYGPADTVRLDSAGKAIRN